jgi:hypothetical protein
MCCFADNSAGDGTLFLQEYDIPLNSPSFCIYDSRSLSDDINENLENIKEWMTAGVHHGGPVLRYAFRAIIFSFLCDDDYLLTIYALNRKSDTLDMRKAILCRGRQLDYLFNKGKTVNFVIFVVNGPSVFQAMRSGDKEYFDKLAENFN